MIKAKKPSFFMNVLTIVFAQFVVKILGFAYRMVITNVDGFGDIGNGYYNFGFQIYTLLLAISSIGIPNAISKLVSERVALDDFKGAMRIYKVALRLFFVVGLFFSCLMYFGASFIAKNIFDTPLSVYTIKALAPSIVFVSVSSVIRGFFAGQQNMQATNTSQVFEQFLKSVSTILIVLSMAGARPEYMAAGATLATTISTLISTLYLFGFYGVHNKSIKEKISLAPPIKLSGSALKISKIILLVSIPISLGSIVATLNRLVDIVTVVHGIKIAFLDKFPTATLLDAEAVRLSGILSKTDVLINLPLALNIAFSTVLVPTVAGALAIKDTKTAQDKVSFSLLISSVIALPATIGYMVLASPILQIIYPNASDGALIFTMVAPTVFFSAMAQTTYGSLQGMGKIFTPALSVLCGGIVKRILNLLLIPIPSINIYGAAISSVFCQGIAFLVSFLVLYKNLEIKLEFTKYFLKPFISSLVMGACVYLIHKALLPFGLLFSTLVSIAVGVIVYILMIFFLKTFTSEEKASIPIVGKFLK